jgi:hypothetical protein
MAGIMVCKLCGAAPSVVVHRDRAGNPVPLPEDGYGILCRKEGVQGKLGHYIEVVSNVRAEAIEEWNRLNS